MMCDIQGSLLKIVIRILQKKYGSTVYKRYQYKKTTEIKTAGPGHLLASHHAGRTLALACSGPHRTPRKTKSCCSTDSGWSRRHPEATRAARERWNPSGKAARR